MMKILILFLLITNLFSSVGQGLEVSRVVAIFDDQVITTKQIKDKIALYKLFMLGQEFKKEDLYNLALQNTIDDLIIESHSQNYTIPDALVMGLLERLLIENSITIKDLETFLVKEGLSLSSLKNHFTRQIIWNNLLTEGEVNQESFSKDFSDSKILKLKIDGLIKLAETPLIKRVFSNKSRILLSEIVIKNNKKEAIQMLFETGDLARVKRAFPQEVELQDSDGSLGWIKFNDLSDLYKEALQETGLKEISPPIVGQNFTIFLKPLAMEGVTITKSLQGADYISLAYDQKIKIELQKSLGENYSQYKLKGLREAHYIKIID